MVSVGGGAPAATSLPKGRTMTPRERVLTGLRRRRPDRIPMALGFFAQRIDALEPRLPEEVFPLDVRFLEFDPPADQEGFLEYAAALPGDVHLGSISQLQTYHEWGYHPEQGPDGPLSRIRSVAELARAVFPEVTHPSRHARLGDRVRRWHAEGLAVAGAPPHLGGELFEMAIRLRGFRTFMADLVERPGLAHYLLDQLADILVQNVVILAEAGCDILLLDDDIAMPTGLLIGPDAWRAFFRPRLSRAIAAAREVSPELLVFYHSDGDFTRLLPDLAAVGIDVVNPLQPDCMDAAAVKAAFGDRLALWGTVGTALSWDRGRPEEIREEVRRRIQTLGPEGLLLSPAYDIDFSPVGNVRAFVDAVLEFGRVS